ncbi:Transcriptional regulator WhiB2 [Corynebacterium ciconiae DSM 44920]|nr:WhiB family transcriptional regulator [Corynebacterium ciconiae]WKD61814.1 Transcriptional regulator WhiB2 [Corynebacterium ciconiae DSM 44920]
MENKADHLVVSSIDGDYSDAGTRDHGDATTRSAAAESSYGELSFDDLFGAVEQEWHDQALCAQTDPEAFFPEKGGSTREAKRICKACGVRDECLEYALLHDERFGIWGGLSERERRRLKKQLG